MDFLDARVIIDNTEIYLNEFSSFNELTEHIEENHSGLPTDWTELEYKDLHDNFISSDGIQEAYWDIIDSLNSDELPMIVDFMDNDSSYYGNNIDELLRNFEDTTKWIDMDSFKDYILDDNLSLSDNIKYVFDFDKYWNEMLSHDYWESPNGYVFSNQ